MIKLLFGAITLISFVLYRADKLHEVAPAFKGGTDMALKDSIKLSPGGMPGRQEMHTETRMKNTWESLPAIIY